MRKFETKKEVKKFLQQFYLKEDEKIVFVSLKENGTFEAVAVIDSTKCDVELYRYVYDAYGIVDCYELDDSYNSHNEVDAKTKMYLERW